MSFSKEVRSLRFVFTLRFTTTTSLDCFEAAISYNRRVESHFGELDSRTEIGKEGMSDSIALRLLLQFVLLLGHMLAMILGLNWMSAWHLGGFNEFESSWRVLIWIGSILLD